MRNGACFPLPPLARRICASASGLWPTPDVPNGGRNMTREDVLNKCRTATGKRQVGLANAVNVWPTPTTRDHHAMGANCNPKAHSLSLSTVIQKKGGAHWPTPKASQGGPDVARRTRTGSGGDDLVTVIGGQLNPAWVEALMGYPPEWTAVD